MNKILEDIIENKYPEYKKLPIVDNILDDDNPRDDFWDDLSEREHYDINAEFLKQTGNPEYDYLTCWEPGRIDDEKETLFDFKTMYDFDYSWWEFQKQAEYDGIEECKKWMEEGSDHWTPEKVAESINRINEKFKNGYEIYCTGDWFRLIEKDINNQETFLYAQVISARWYLFYELEGYLSDLQDELLPYTLNEDRGDFLKMLNEKDPEKRYKAGGREKELDTLQDLIRKYEQNQLLDLIDTTLLTYPKFSGRTFRFDRGYYETETQKFDPFTDFIFWDEQSLRNVRTTNFLNDFTQKEKNPEDFTEIIELLKVQVKKDFMAFYDKNRSRYIQK